MRIRQVKPAFWTDETLAPLIQLGDTALFYIGLWMQADDAGFIRWEPRRIAAELYPYEALESREAAVLMHKVALEGAGRLRVYKCGHALIPRLTEHQRLGGEDHRVYTFRNEHNKCRAPRVPAGPRQSPPGRVGEGRVGKGRVENAHARENGAENGVTTIEEHDAVIKRTPTPEEEAQTWITLWRTTRSERAEKKAEAELKRLGYVRKGNDWVPA